MKTGAKWSIWARVKSTERYSMANNSINEAAKHHYNSVAGLDVGSLPPHSQWAPILQAHAKFIQSCRSERQAMDFVLQTNNYDHRNKKHRPDFIFQYFENILYNLPIVQGQYKDLSVKRPSHPRVPWY